MFVSAVMLFENVTNADRQKISSTQRPIAKRVNSYARFPNPDLKAPKRPILAKKADGLLNEFCSTHNSNYEICSTDKDCHWVAGGDRSSHHYCLGREEGPSICCEKLAMLLPSVEKISTKPLPIAKRVDSYTCFKKSTSGKRTTSAGFQYCSTDADCENAKIPGLYAGQKDREYPRCFSRKAGFETMEEPPICCNNWALYD